MSTDHSIRAIPFLGARKFARALLGELAQLESERDTLARHLAATGALTVAQLEDRRVTLEREVEAQLRRLEEGQKVAREDVHLAGEQLAKAREAIVQTDELALLQEAGVYQYRHPLTDAVAYQQALDVVEAQIKEMVKKDGGAVLATTSWSVNGSEAQGRTMVRDFSKLMLRAFNAEADNLVRGLKPFKLGSAIERLTKVADVIEKLGRTMHIRIAPSFLGVRVRELELTADFRRKEAEQKELERVERERLREERKVQQEIERERLRLDKERKHVMNALAVLEAQGNEAAAERVREQLADVQRAIADVDYRAANIRAGYVYVISNLGSFGESIIKVGMTRRLDPMDRIRELSDASVPFNFDIHALFFSKDAVGIETAMHERLAARRINLVNHRREFFRATPGEAKAHLLDLAGELLQFQELAEALEYRECLTRLQQS